MKRYRPYFYWLGLVLLLALSMGAPLTCWADESGAAAVKDAAQKGGADAVKQTIDNLERGAHTAVNDAKNIENGMNNNTVTTPADKAADAAQKAADKAADDAHAARDAADAAQKKVDNNEPGSAREAAKAQEDADAKE